MSSISTAQAAFDSASATTFSFARRTSAAIDATNAMLDAGYSYKNPEYQAAQEAQTQLQAFWDAARAYMMTAAQELIDSFRGC